MARQNIDEKWKTDPRRTALAKRIGSRNADGMRVEINWLILDHKGQPIPLKEFKFIENANDWIECGLAEIVGDFVKIAGADRYDEFFEKQKENGKKGGRPKNPNKPKITQNNPTITQTKPEKPSFSFSSSFSSSISNSNSEGAILEKSPNPVSVYCDLWKEKNGRSPDIRGKEAGQLTGLAKDLGGSRACELIRVYFSMPDPFFIKRGFDVSTLLSNLAAIQQFEANGKIVTRKVQEHFEEAVDKAQGTNRKPRKRIEDLERERAEMLAEANVLPMVGGKS